VNSDTLRSLELTPRVRALHQQILTTKPAVCSERAVLITRYLKRRKVRRQPVVLQRAGGLAHVLRDKQVRIHPSELLVGAITAHRVGGGIVPELHGVAMLEDLVHFRSRETNPLALSGADRRRLLGVLPYWLPRFLALKAFPARDALRFVTDQLNPSGWLINETGGISHFVPDYGALVTLGTEGLRERAEARRVDASPDSDEARFCEAVGVVCQGLEDFAEGYAREAERRAGEEREPIRRAELEQIAVVCRRVPRQPATTLHEALQAIVFVQIALNLESLDNSVSPGRLDRVLEPFLQADLTAGRLDLDGAFELLGCFALKLCEIVPVFSRRLTRFHGGMFNGQVVVVGGVDEDGEDCTGEVSHLFVELMDRLRTRQPNYHARLHAGSPPAFRQRVAEVLAAGAASPALYNDEVIVPMLQARGMEVGDARDYATVGCVEPTSAGRSFLSTDAALFNLARCLELALNQGRPFGSKKQVGASTPSVSSCGNLDEVIGLLEQQVRFNVERLLADLQAIEQANARLHPTPLTSMLVEGCLDSARDASAGGARYNGSGIQGVGVVEVGDSLAALDAVVFRDGAATLEEVVEACRSDFVGAEALRARLLRAPRFGNDDPVADRLVGRVMSLFADVLEAHTNTRGGDYAAGFYSVTAHHAFGEVVGALPSGRRAGEAFSSGLSPALGAERAGPTASLGSQTRLPLDRARNGVNYNLKLAPWVVAGDDGATRLRALVDGGFAAGCMQLQVNVLDPGILEEARDNPGKHPGLLVRVSGYSAYFDDLSPEMKQEIIDRTCFEAAGGEAPVS